MKKPLHTSIAVDAEEFDDLSVPEKLHIIVSVKDFRAILTHAGLTSGSLSAAYSRPGRPMKVSYDGDGIVCEFILMTVGEKGTIAQKKGKGRAGATKPVRPALEAASTRSASVVANENPQPSEPARNQKAKAPIPRPPVPRPSQFEIRPLPNQPPSTLRSESMFLPQDDDQQWEPVNPDDDEDEGENARLEWDASMDPVCLTACSLLLR